MSWYGGDWMCGVCEHINFKKRETCQSCRYPKYGGTDPSTYRYNKTEALAGDWFCNCGAHNYDERMETGFAQESAVEYIIMLAGQSASNAKCQGILNEKKFQKTWKMKNAYSLHIF
ncbi:hypothetical protein D0Y65_004480 [Glycine soja]|uniref:RanBP2-type domain-containing protein n=1 Tax=Glycine soja TaxID=3848 RepID=A0A445LRG8_GLYSO|nr:hypothetical protein D0Y65_004480 [Glycine soja]